MWSMAINAGLSSEEFWHLTPRELQDFFEVRNEQQHHEDIRFGLIASVIVNVNRSKGAAMVRPEQFFVQRRREEDFMSVDEAKLIGRQWAAAQNAGAATVDGQQVEGSEQ